LETRFIKFGFLLAIVIILGTQSSFAQNNAQTQQSQATDIYDAQSLSKGTVLPRVDYPETVLNKNVTFTKKFEIALERLTATDELFFNNALYGVKLGYHWNEEFSFGINYQKWSSGLNEYGQTFADHSTALDFSRAPQPQSNFLLYLSHLYFYGKISFTRDTVLTHVFLGRYSLGMTQYDVGTLPHFNYALGFQTYFNRKFFFELGYGLSLHQAYNAVSQDIRTASPVVDKQSFDKKLQLSQYLNLIFGVIF